MQNLAEAFTYLRYHLAHPKKLSVRERLKMAAVLSDIETSMESYVEAHENPRSEVPNLSVPLDGNMVNR